MNPIIDKITKAQLEIGNTCDGPITPFVLISRAVTKAHESDTYDPETIADALYNLLDSWGFLNDNT